MKNILIPIMLLASLVFSGCKKSLLDTSPNDRYVESNFWNSQKAADAALSGCYNVLTYSGLFGGDATPLWEEGASSNAYTYSNSMGFNFIAEGQQSASSTGIIPARWHDCYTGIGRCNSFLVHVDEVPGMDDAIKERMKGEALFLRALYYFMLENYYGGVPLVLDPPDRETQTNLPRNSREEVVQQIIADLDQAASVLPLKYTGGNVGRVTQGAALALKARILLYEASPLNNPDNAAAKWQTAANAAKAVIDLSSQAGYGLFNNYRSLFLPENENNKEVIFDVQFIYPGEGNSFDLICGQYNTNAPLLDLSEAYEMNNGLPITDPASGYDPASPYLNRDPRFYATIVYPGEVWTNGSQTVKVTSSWFAITGYAMQKLSIFNTTDKPPVKSSDIKGGQSYINYIWIRYADILLMYAEAQNEASGPETSVYDALNQVRTRAGMPAIDPIYTKDQLREMIRHERRIEFAGEGLYYNDIRRWKTAENELNATIYKYDQSAIETRKFNPGRDYWWPIPQTELDLNPKLQQNSGY